MIRTTKGKKNSRMIKMRADLAGMYLMFAVTLCLMCGQVAGEKGHSEDMIRDIADISAEIDIKSSWFSFLERMKRDNSDYELQLARQKRDERNLGESTFDEPEELNKESEFFEQDFLLSRQKRNKDDTKNTEQVLIRKKRTGGEENYQNVEKAYPESNFELTRQKRSRADSTNILSRKKRDNIIPHDELDTKLSNQKSVTVQEDKEELSRQKRDDDAMALLPKESIERTEEIILSRQKRGNLDTAEEIIESNDNSEMELSIVKRNEEDASGKHTQASSNEQHLETENSDAELSRQKRHKIVSSSESLARKRRRLLQVFEQELTDNHAGASSGSKQKHATSKPSSKEVKKAEPPEHRNYHEDLLERRMKIVRMENKRRKRERSEVDPEEEDDWEQELRIRRELAEKALADAIQKKKERAKTPVLNPEEMSILQRIKHDAEEILRRRAEEARLKKDPVLKETSLFVPTFTQNQEGDGEEELMKKRKKKTNKAIEDILQLKKTTTTSAPAQQPPEPEILTIQGNSTVYEPLTDASDSILKFKRMVDKTRGGRKKRKKRKKRSKKQKRDFYFEYAALPN